MPDLFVECEKFVQKIGSRIKLPPVEDNYDLSQDEDLLEKIDITKYCLRQYPDVRIQFESIFDNTIQVVDTYYICNGK